MASATLVMSAPDTHPEDVVAPDPTYYYDVVRQVAATAARNTTYVERDDVEAELMLFLIEKIASLAPLLDAAQDADAYMTKVLTRQANNYCKSQRERIQRELGRFFYSFNQVRDLLACWFTYELWLPSPSVSDPERATEITATADPAHGNERLAELADISLAWPHLNGSYRTVIESRYLNPGESWEKLAHEAGMTEANYRRSHSRAINALIALMNGEAERRPAGPGTRRALSNAAAQMITRYHNH